MRNPVEIKLPRSTSSPASGPVFRYGANRLTVDYEDYDENGTIVWTRLEFTDVAAMKFTEAGQCDGSDFGEYDSITCWDSSPWLSAKFDRWRKTYPNADPNESKPWLHYRLYCDHAGSLHVIASDVKIIENPELDALNSLPPCR